MRTLCFLILTGLVATAIAQSCDLTRGWACTGGIIQTLHFDDDEVTFMEAHNSCTLYQQGEFEVDDETIEIEFDGLLDWNFFDCDIVGEDDHECECYEDPIEFKIIGDDCSSLEGPNGEVCTPTRHTYECNFRTCPHGQRLVPNPDYESTANGCGPASVPITAPSFSFEQCCIEHDHCYGGCSVSKKECDDLFYECMYCSCSRDTSIGELFCEELACLYYQSVNEFGCGAFESSQGNGCICEGQEKKDGFVEIPNKFGPEGTPRATRALICNAPFSVSESVCRARSDSNTNSDTNSKTNSNTNSGFSNIGISSAAPLALSGFVLLVVVLVF